MVKRNNQKCLSIAQEGSWQTNEKVTRKKINGLTKLSKNLKSVEERKGGKVEEERNIYFYHLFILRCLSVTSQQNISSLDFTDITPVFLI